MQDKIKKVLYADDDNDDQTWISDACRTINCALEIFFVENGKQVLDHLSHIPSEHLPSLIVLDLNMPELDGRQTLQKLKSHPVYQHIPVVIVTTSSNKVDKEICTRLGAALYLTKPDTYNEWENIVRQFEPFVN